METSRFGGGVLRLVGGRKGERKRRKGRKCQVGADRCERGDSETRLLGRSCPLVKRLCLRRDKIQVTSHFKITFREQFESGELKNWRNPSKVYNPIVEHITETNVQ